MVQYDIVIDDFGKSRSLGERRAMLGESREVAFASHWREGVMRALVDVHKCSGQARCVAVAPDIFVLNDDGYNERVENAVPSGLDEQARRGVRACPERAITLVEDASGPLADAVDGEGR